LASEVWAVVDGALGAQLLEGFKTLVENPNSLTV
jgi:hypothetical protein